MTNYRHNPIENNAPRVKVAVKAAQPNVLPILLVAVGIVVLLINGALSGI